MTLFHYAAKNYLKIFQTLQDIVAEKLELKVELKITKIAAFKMLKISAVKFLVRL